MAERSITESIYIEVRFAVLSGQYLPGQILDRDELCLVYGCKSAIVVDALNALVMEGYLDLPRRGVFGVRHWRPVEINDLFDIRASMMGMAAARAAERSSDPEIMQLAQHAKQSTKFDFTSETDTEALAIASAEIQSMIVKMARVTTITEMARSMGPNALLRKCQWAQSPNQLQRSWKLLVKMCKEISNRKPDSAQAAMAQYVEATRGPLVSASKRLEKIDWPEFPQIRRIECSTIHNGCSYGAGAREPAFDGRIVPFGVSPSR